MAQLGCTVAHAAAVKRLLVQGGAGLPKMSTISSLLRCLVCCTGLASPDNSLPERTHGVTRRLRALALDDPPDESNIDWPAPRRAPPSYVQRLIETPGEERGRIIEELRREIGQVGALVVFKEKGPRWSAAPPLVPCLGGFLQVLGWRCAGPLRLQPLKIIGGQIARLSSFRTFSHDAI